MNKRKRVLKIYIDETGDNGEGKGSSELYGFSFVFYDSDIDISNELNKLNKKLFYIEFKGVLHITDLIMNRKEYSLMPMKKRKSIFNYLFYFYKNSGIRSKSFFVKKKEANDRYDLNNRLTKILKQFIDDNYLYLSSFDDVCLYYDNGQILLTDLFNNTFIKLNNYRGIYVFNKETERLFQVADMITFLDKTRFKIEKKVYSNSGEKYFFDKNELKKISSVLDKNELK